MKTISIKLFIGALLMLAATSCSEEKVPFYEDVSRIYFAYVNANLQEESNINNTMISMGYDDPVKSDSIIVIKVRTMGPISTIDRPITAEVIQTESSAIAGVDIKILPSVVKAGEPTGYLRVSLHNSEKLETNTVTARIRLTPNEYFHVDWNAVGGDRDNNTSGLEYNITFDSKNEIPNLWKDAAMLNTFFGPWSRVKEQLIYDLLGVDRSFLTYDPATENASTVVNQRIPRGMEYTILGIITRYLTEWKEEKGDEMRDENGNPVRMGITSIL